MSEKHTQGKLIARPIDRSGWVDVVVKEEDGGDSLPFISCKHIDVEANARRLVACWNACDGLDTDLLENIVTLGDTLKSRFALRDRDEAELRARRDELLAALKAIVLADDNQCLNQFDIERARAAIANAEGSKVGDAS